MVFPNRASGEDCRIALSSQGLLGVTNNQWRFRASFGTYKSRCLDSGKVVCKKKKPSDVLERTAKGFLVHPERFELPTLRIEA